MFLVGKIFLNESNRINRVGYRFAQQQLQQQQQTLKAELEYLCRWEKKIMEKQQRENETKKERLWILIKILHSKIVWTAVCTFTGEGQLKNKIETTLSMLLLQNL